LQIFQDIWGNSDHFRYTYESTSGDVTVSVRITSMDYRGKSTLQLLPIGYSTESWTKAGLMIRDSLEPGAKHFSMLLTGMNDARTFYRTEKDGSSSTRGTGNAVHDSIWLKVTRRGRSFKGFKSLDGKIWQLVDKEVIIDMNSADIKVGIALTSHHPDRLTETTFTEYENLSYEYPSSAPTSTPAPSYGHMGLDIGKYDSMYPSKVSIQGDKTIITASGADIWGTEDSFTFINHQVQGDFTMTARVNSVVATNSWAKFGLMMRESVAKNAKQVFVFLAPNQGTMMHVRKATGDVTYNQYWMSPAKTNWTWLKLEKKGDVITGYASIVGGDDDTEWHPVYEYNLPFVSPMEIGMAVTSHESRKYATAEFEHFEIEQGTPVRRLIRGGTN